MNARDSLAARQISAPAVVIPAIAPTTNMLTRGPAGQQRPIFNNASLHDHRGHEVGGAFELKQSGSGNTIKLDMRTSLSRRGYDSASYVTELKTTIARANRDNSTRRDAATRLLELSGAFEAANALGYASAAI